MAFACEACRNLADCCLDIIQKIPYELRAITQSCYFSRSDEALCAADDSDEEEFESVENLEDEDFKDVLSNPTNAGREMSQFSFTSTSIPPNNLESSRHTLSRGDIAKNVQKYNENGKASSASLTEAASGKSTRGSDIGGKTLSSVRLISGQISDSEFTKYASEPFPRSRFARRPRSHRAAASYDYQPTKPPDLAVIDETIRQPEDFRETSSLMDGRFASDSSSDSTHCVKRLSLPELRMEKTIRLDL